MALLDEDAIGRELAATSGWEQEGPAIVGRFTLHDFATAMGFVNRVAGLAEEADHHPDITIRWNKVTLSLSTHSAGGITDKDFALARKINAL